jgi:hypothetical protein
VFRGTVKKVGASNVAGVPASKKTALVTVDAVVRGPAALSRAAGQVVTVRFSRPPRLKAKQKALFHTTGWLFGETLAVVASGFEPLPAARRSSAAEAAADPAEHLALADLDERLATAQTVVTGRVISVAPVTAARRTLAAGGEPFVRKSEHDPFWHDAVVKVESTEKGAPEGSVVVRFPASQDVRWYHAPKLRKGQQGVFLLHPQEGAAPAARRRGAVAGPTVLMALHPQDVRPAEQVELVRSRIKG